MTLWGQDFSKPIWRYVLPVPYFIIKGEQMSPVILDAIDRQVSQEVLEREAELVEAVIDETLAEGE